MLPRSFGGTPLDLGSEPFDRRVDFARLLDPHEQIARGVVEHGIELVPTVGKAQLDPGEEHAVREAVQNQTTLVAP
jgi:hypothetical protein